ncbi:MAG TPA: HAD-IIIA family hydrolase [Spirochaetota bacterium]
MNAHEIDSSWTLFLDRDGVINVRLADDYVKNVDEFQFIDGALEAISILSRKFRRIIVVTNQRGISRGLMTADDLSRIHHVMIDEELKAGGRIDATYHCPHNKDEGCSCRKPAIGMAIRAREEFPEINFSKSIMAGDSRSDMDFGEYARMHCVYISSDNKSYAGCPHPVFNSLLSFARWVDGK